MYIYTGGWGGGRFFSLLTSGKERKMLSALSVMLIYPTFGTFYQEKGVYRMPLAVKCVVYSYLILVRISILKVLRKATHL